MTYQEILERYPLLYGDLSYIECGQGWIHLINGLSAKLEALIAAQHEPLRSMYRAEQVKEKFGALRFYMSSETEAMKLLIEEAEEASEQICERCGSPGSVRGTFWVVTRCDSCA